MLKKRQRRIAASQLFYLRQLSASFRPGEFRSIFRGEGGDFVGLRSYEPGDSPRRIDWPRSITSYYSQGTLVVREEEERRQLAVIFAVDVSPSQLIGFESPKLERICFFVELVSELCLQEGVEIGYLFFADRVYDFKKPPCGESEILRALALMHKVLESRQTSLRSALEELVKFNRASVVFLISDFVAPFNWRKSLRKANLVHTVVPIAIVDRLDVDPPANGLWPVSNVESGKTFFASKAVSREPYSKKLARSFSSAGLPRAFYIGQGAGETEWIRELVNIFNELRKRRS